jgi:hypothetical protein
MRAWEEAAAMTSHPALIRIDYLECDIPQELTLREYGRALARARRQPRPHGISARFRALATSHARPTTLL